MTKKTPQPVPRHSILYPEGHARRWNQSAYGTEVHCTAKHVHPEDGEDTGSVDTGLSQYLRRQVNTSQCPAPEADDTRYQRDTKHSTGEYYVHMHPRNNGDLPTTDFELGGANGSCRQTDPRTAHSGKNHTTSSIGTQGITPRLATHPGQDIPDFSDTPQGGSDTPQGGSDTPPAVPHSEHGEGSGSKSVRTTGTDMAHGQQTDAYSHGLLRIG